MKKIFSFLFGLGASFILQAQTDHSKMALQLLNELDQRKYTAVYSMFDSTMKAGLDTAKLRQMWEGLLVQVGPFKKVASTSITGTGSSDV
ncbi:MAG TPA: DUF3887 domain-containing protein, partial [Bacteroidia bacterium]